MHVKHPYVMGHLLLLLNHTATTAKMGLVETGLAIIPGAGEQVADNTTAREQCMLLHIILYCKLAYCT